MRKTRVIPQFLISRRRLVKTSGFSSPVYVGDPINATRIFSDKGADELIVLDISATCNGHGPDLGYIESVASEALMPVCYGGGIKSVDEALDVLKAGIEKVSLNSAAFDDMTLIRRIADRTGSQSVVFSLDCRRSPNGEAVVYAHARGEAIPSVDPVKLAISAVQAGAGEILLNSVDRDGTLSGYDTDLIRAVSANVSVPVIAAGGSRGIADFRAAVDCGASAVAVGAAFVFFGPHRSVLLQYPDDASLSRALP